MHGLSWETVTVEVVGIILPAETGQLEVEKRK
jgi:hypothetical protein